MCQIGQFGLQNGTSLEWINSSSLRYNKIIRYEKDERYCLWRIIIRLFVMSGCSGSQKEGQDSKEIPVEIVKVAKTVPADTRNYVGTVEEVVSSSISFQVMGNVERVLVGEGRRSVRANY